ncbi:hypothetical protein M5K25_008547 [Dendrobium thyrsiflorum]|uniref:DUF4283 domain-containing protein n=1 Tax=Dendrobium thyrsiflorum TaxID=117978 RepID=A0ABD0VFM4_DENTH
MYAAFSVTLLDPRHVLIKLENDLDYSRIFAHRSYYVFNCYMKVIKWSPLFDISAESPIVLIWISFPELRPHFFSPRILLGMGSLFGRPLHIDNVTTMRSRPSVERVLVELVVIKQYPASIWLGPKKYGYVQKVVMNDFPEFCDHCKMLGHCKLQCYHLNPNLRKANDVKAKTPVVEELVNPREIVSNQILNNSQTPSKNPENNVPLAKQIGNGDEENGKAKANDINKIDTITHQDGYQAPKLLSWAMTSWKT